MEALSARGAPSCSSRKLWRSLTSDPLVECVACAVHDVRIPSAITMAQNVRRSEYRSIQRREKTGSKNSNSKKYTREATALSRLVHYESSRSQAVLWQALAVSGLVPSLVVMDTLEDPAPLFCAEEQAHLHVGCPVYLPAPKLFLDRAMLS
jgi:hypothetical protein